MGRSINEKQLEVALKVAMRQLSDEISTMMQAQIFVVLHALITEGVLDYENIKSAIGVVRGLIPKEKMTYHVAAILDTMEKQWSSDPMRPKN